MLQLEGFHGQTIQIPEDLLYSKDQELWVKAGEEPQTWKFGFTQAGVALVSGFTYMEFVAGVGDHLKQGSPILAVDTYKVSFELYSPMEGTIIYLNQELEGEAVQVLETDPYGQVLFALRGAPDFDPGEKFMTARAYLEALETGCVSICGR